MIKPTREHSHWAGRKSVEWDRATIESFDLVLMIINHSCVNYQDPAGWAHCIVGSSEIKQYIALLREISADGLYNLRRAHVKKLKELQC